MILAEFIASDQEPGPAACISIANRRASPASFKNGIRDFQPVGAVAGCALEHDRTAVSFTGGIAAKEDSTNGRIVRSRDNNIALIVCCVMNLPAELHITDRDVIGGDPDRFIKVACGRAEFLKSRQPHSLPVNRDRLVDQQSSRVKVRALIDMNHAVSIDSRNPFCNCGMCINPVNSGLRSCGQKIHIRDECAGRHSGKCCRNKNIRQRRGTANEHDIVAVSAVVKDPVLQPASCGNDRPIAQACKRSGDCVGRSVVGNDCVSVTKLRCRGAQILQIQSDIGPNRDSAGNGYLVVVDPSYAARMAACVVVINFYDECRVACQCEVAAGDNPRTVARRQHTPGTDRQISINFQSSRQLCSIATN